MTTSSSQQIELNGEPHQTQADSVAALIAELGLPGRKIAVERNLEIVPKSAYAETEVTSGDRIEIVHFVGGG